MDLNQFYWALKLGIPKNKASIYDIRSDIPAYVKEPVFFLSTGRCGTKWFSDLLEKDRALAVFHRPVPSLAIQGRQIYKRLVKGNGNLSEAEKSMIMEIFWAAREDPIRYTYKTGKRYLETNNYITFFAPVLKEIFPDAKFVHLIRHPGEFVRSGISRHYYSGKSMDAARLSPENDEEKKYWEKMGQFSKVAWLWNETNRLIDQMMADSSAHLCKRFIINDMSLGSVKDLLTFLEISLPDRAIRNALPKKKNTQKHTLDPFISWERGDKEEVIRITSELAETYGFSFQNK